MSSPPNFWCLAECLNTISFLKNFKLKKKKLISVLSGFVKDVESIKNMVRLGAVFSFYKFFIGI